MKKGPFLGWSMIVTVCMLTQSCQSLNPSTQKLQNELPQSTAPELTLGAFQSKVMKGMYAGDVAAAVGSPNMVEKRKGNKEVWIYDKVASESAVASQRVGGGAGAGMLAGGSHVVGGFGATVSADKAGTVRRTAQKSLTVVITFVDGQVVDTDYLMTQF